jgi:hypothetical protein
MASTSAIVNRALRAHVAPFLREAGFAKTDARNGWRWLDKTVWVFNIRAVGNYFSEVTGWPPGSVGVWLGVFYSFMPTDRPIKVDDEGRPLPAEHLCQIRSHLECTLDQSQRLGRLPNPAERDRKDIWWIEPHGSNAASVATDIASALKGQAFPWFEAHSNLAAALSEVEGSHDCFVKFDTAALLARELGDRAKVLEYAERASAEGRRIGRRLDPKERYGA